MIRKIMAEVDVKLGVKSILERIEVAYANRQKNLTAPKPLLVAVSKTKPVQLISEAYSAGQRHFGENYVQELIEKGTDPILLENCPEIKWHFIGHLQRNKINKIINIPGIYMIQTVDSEKLATALDNAWSKLDQPNKERLRVLAQVNTSNEEEKSGVQPSEIIKLFGYIKDNCSNLKVEGIMTIGKFGYDYSLGPNPDFDTLLQCQRNISESFGLDMKDIHLSMGMSADFDEAIKMGSTIVRVGTSIFGFRSKKNE